MRGINFLVILAALITLSSCTHIHVPANAKRANDIKAEYITAINNKDSNIYSIMLDNKKLMEATETARLEMLKKEKNQLFAYQLYQHKWEEISKFLSKENEALNSQLNTESDDLASFNKRLKEMINKKDSSAVTLKNVQDLLQEKVKEQNQWYARHELFRKSIKTIADISVSKETEENFNLKDALLKQSEILNEKIDYIELTFDQDGKAIIDNKTEETEKKSIKEILFTEEDNIIKIIKKSEVGNFLNEDQAPGIKIIILGLAVDLADKELKRNNLETNYLKTVIDLFIDNKLRINKKISDIITAQKIIQNLMPSLIKNDDNVLIAINNLRKPKAPSRSLESALKALAYYSSAKMEDVSVSHDLHLAMLDHEYSIKLSAINAQEHEALISRGLEGLSIYHEGGVTPEDVANFLRVLQTAALAVIGAGVL